MQDKDEKQEALAGRLQRALTERDAARRAFHIIARQRESEQQEVKNLRASLANASSRLEAIHQQETRNNEHAGAAPVSPHTSRRTRRWSRTTAAAISVFAVATLVSTAVFHDAQSNVKKNGQAEVSSGNTLETVQRVSDKAPPESDRKSPPKPDKKKTRFARLKDASQRQWGPALLMPSPGAAKSNPVFDPQVKEQQRDLLTLGFDVGEADGFQGARTRQSMAEFRALYLPHAAKPPQGIVLANIIRNYANLARRDAGKFGIDHGVVAAIRLSSVRTGVDFSYLMKLAQTESDFNPASESATSSATGMYQFTRDTWLNTLKLHGADYGLADYAAQIEHYVTRSGYRQPRVRDQKVYEHLLALRKNPRISAIMAAESVRDSRQALAHLFDREPTQADLYLTHFLGTDAAITFLKSLHQNPDTFAEELFPEAAGSNHDIFQPQICNPRTVDEVYELFGEKFSTRRYDDLAAN